MLRHNYRPPSPSCFFFSFLLFLILKYFPFSFYTRLSAWSTLFGHTELNWPLAWHLNRYSIFNLAIDDSNRASLGEAGACETVLQLMARHSSGYEKIALFGARHSLYVLPFRVLFHFSFLSKSFNLMFWWKFFFFFLSNILHFYTWSFLSIFVCSIIITLFVLLGHTGPICPHASLGVAAIANLAYHCRPNQDRLGEGFDLG